MKEGQLDIGFARVARDQGMQAAEDHANEEKIGWSADAYAMLLKYLETHKDSFMAEEFREWAYSAGLDIPPSHRAFGGTLMKAAKAGLIKKVGHGQVSNIKAHACFATIWIKA